MHWHKFRVIRYINWLAAGIGRKIIGVLETGVYYQLRTIELVHNGIWHFNLTLLVVHHKTGSRQVVLRLFFCIQFKIGIVVTAVLNGIVRRRVINQNLIVRVTKFTEMSFTHRGTTVFFRAPPSGLSSTILVPYIVPR